MEAETPFQRLLNAAIKLSAPLGSTKALSVVSGGAFLVFVLVIFVFSIVLPVYNYDAVPSVGTALKSQGLSDETAHKQAWAAFQSKMPESDFDELSRGNEYRMRQSSDADAFASVLPLYSVKFGYVYLFSLAQDAKHMVVTASWVSHLSALVLGLTSFFWMYRSRSLQGAAFVVSLLLMTNYFSLSRSIGPDILASALTLIGLYFWLQKRAWVSMALLLVALTFRPDTIILLFAFILVSILFKTEKLPAFLAFGGGLAISIWMQKLMGHPGWWTHYYFSTVSIQPSLEGFKPAFSIFAWLKGFGRGVFMSIANFNWAAVFLTLLAGLAVMVKSGLTFSQRQTALITACILTIGGKFLIFPLPDSRLYLVFLLAILLTCLEVWKPDFSWSKPRKTS